MNKVFHHPNSSDEKAGLDFNSNAGARAFGGAVGADRNAAAVKVQAGTQSVTL
jgi:hypothetical protein